MTQTATPLPEINHFGEPLTDLIPIPIEDNGEPLVDVFAVCPQLKWMAKSPRFDFRRYGLGRESLANMLAEAQSRLPSGIYLQIIGVYRPFSIQKLMYDKVRDELREKHPEWDEEYLTRYINVYAAAPVTETPPPHTTGGAVDLWLVDELGERLDMISPLEMGWPSAPMYQEGLSSLAQENRSLLRSVLLPTGLTNFPGEWWHWTYGEPGWALRGGHAKAIYGLVPEESIPEWTAPGE